MIKYPGFGHQSLVKESAMKNTLCLFTLLLGLVACTNTVATPTSPAASATAMPIPSATITPLPTETVAPTATPTPTPEPTPTHEVALGGTGVGVAFWYADGVSMTHTPPQEIASDLVPTSPDKWPSLMNLTDSTGTPLPWGKPAFFDYWQGGPGDGISPVIPFLLRAVVPYGIWQGENAPNYLAIFEAPAQGGSNFYVLELTSQGQYTNSKYTYIKYPSAGVPVDWVGQNVSIQNIMPYTVDRLSDTEAIKILQANIGKVVLLEFSDSIVPDPPYDEMVKYFLDDTLLPSGFQASLGIPSFYLPAGQ